jgi:archaemetzincin
VQKKAALSGDWLAQHKEAGQTFDEYLRSNPNRPTKQLTTMYLVALGDFTTTQTRLIEDTADLMGRWYGVPVKLLDGIPLEVIPASARRTHPEWNDKQILSTHVLDMLKARRPPDGVSVMALTPSDLWPGQGWNFVFGQASLHERTGVWSFYRFGNPESDYRKVLKRTVHTATHETGHMLGILHCIHCECGMNGSNNLDESDRIPLWFCPECEPKIWWACQVDPVKRYEALIDFADKHGLEKEAEFWRKCVETLKR